MASVGSLTSSTSNSIRGYGGLASGLDRDELIKSMTLGTTSKLNQQEQKKQKIEWMQEAVRTISDKMISFHGKYTETLTSSSNLFSSMLWGRNKITTTGVNSKYVSVSGTAKSADAMTIMGIKQKAQNASLSTKGMASDRVLSSDAIDVSQDYSTLAGKTLGFSVDGKDYVITLNEADLKSLGESGMKDPNAIATLINSKLKSVDSLDGEVKGTDLTKFVEVAASSDGKGFKVTANDDNRVENVTKFLGGTALEYMGMENEEVDFSIGTSANSVESDSSKVKLTKTFEEMVKGQTLTFSYNGTSEQVTIDKAASLEEVKKSLQDSLDAKFGKGRIAVDIEEKNNGEKALTFKTTVPGENGKEDDTSILQFTGGSAEAREALGLSVGLSNRVNMNAKVSEYGFAETDITKRDKDGNVVKDEAGNTVTERGYQIKLNGETIEVKKDATVNDLMNAINASGANVTVSYQEAADKFTFTSKEDGASGVIDFSGNEDTPLAALQNIFGLEFEKTPITINPVEGSSDQVQIQIGDKIETLKAVTVGTDVVYEDAQGNAKYYKDGNDGELHYADGSMKKVSDVSPVRGKDAIVSVKYAGSDEIVDLRRGTNTFTVDGLTINVKGVFGYKTDDDGNLVDENGKILEDVKDAVRDKSADPVEINAEVDVDRLMSTIKSFVEDYNSIVDLVNSELTTKHDRDYDPLTSDQKEELSENEITKWETKAKEGLLYGDSDLRSLSMDLRVVVSGGNLVALEKVGISVSSTYSDNGKLSIDETKLRAALETNPEDVEKLFTSTKGVDENGNETFNGLATNLKNVMDKYVKTTGPMESKGILIRKAGSKSAAMSLTQNVYYNQLTSIDKMIATLQARLKTEQDRYISQFSTLETMISNMNSQASYLSSM